MRVHAVVVLAVSSLVLAGCQQQDGPLPATNEEVTNRIEDVAHDLSNVAGGNQQAPAELNEDLIGFLEGGPGREAAEELGKRLAKAVARRKMTAETAHKLAERLWVGMAARELSERQREQIVNEVRDLLSSMMVERAEVEAVATQTAAVQQAVTTRTRAWYERF
jgi:hypothetical protein